MELRELYEKLVDLNHQRMGLADDYVDQACEDLIPLLLKLRDYNEVAVYETNHSLYVDLRFIHKYLAIRYCGRFVNVIKINKEGSGYGRMSLSYRYIESDAEYNRFQDDHYKIDSPDEFGIQLYDAKRLLYFIYALIPFFKGGIHEEEYVKFWKSQGDRKKEITKLDDKIAEEINEGLEIAFSKIFDKYFVNRNTKKRFLLLPYDVSVRYRGRFHNCIISDNYSTSLGYVKNTYDMSEDDYNQDPYTVEFDASRYPEKEYILLHETSLIATESNAVNLQMALKTILTLCEHELENGELNTLTGQDVEFKKTIFTE